MKRQKVNRDRHEAKEIKRTSTYDKTAELWRRKRKFKSERECISENKRKRTKDEAKNIRERKQIQRSR